jgi:hypothetical protein
MNISLTDQMVSQFLSGVIAIFALIAVGATLSALFKAMDEKFTFTRLALIMALSPLSLVNFLDAGYVSTLYLFSMIVALLGITIDGINFLLLPKERIKTESTVEKEEASEIEPDSSVIIWEKAE